MIHCKNCGNQFNGKYCNVCGEKVYHEKDKKISHFFEEGLHFLTHFEGTLFTTLKTLATRPGKLSSDINNGIRKRYFKPLSLFLLLVVIYLLFPFVEGLHMQLQYYPGLFGSYAQEMIDHKLTTTGLNAEELASVFLKKSETLSKFLLIIIIPLSALFFKLIFFKRKKYFFDYLVYVAEINSVYLLWAYLIFAFILWLFNIRLEDRFYGVYMLIPFWIYVIISAKNFFRINWWKSVLLSTLFIFVHAVIIIQFIYKLILFFLTMKQIH